MKKKGLPVNGVKGRGVRERIAARRYGGNRKRQIGVLGLVIVRRIKHWTAFGPYINRPRPGGEPRWCRR